MPHALVLQFPSAEALPSALLSRLPEPDYADEKRMRFIVEEGFSLSEADADYEIGRASCRERV